MLEILTETAMDLGLLGSAEVLTRRSLQSMVHVFSIYCGLLQWLSADKSFTSYVNSKYFTHFESITFLKIYDSKMLENALTSKGLSTQ